MIGEMKYLACGLCVLLCLCQNDCECFFDLLFAGRHDIAANVSLLHETLAQSSLVVGDSFTPYTLSLIRNKMTTSETESGELDGMDGVHTRLAAVRFGGDSRLLEARRLLASNTPILLRGSEQTDEAGESTQWQQAKLQTLATRTMALPLGKFHCRTVSSLPTQSCQVLTCVLCMYRLCRPWRISSLHPSCFANRAALHPGALSVSPHR